MREVKSFFWKHATQQRTTGPDARRGSQSNRLKPVLLTLTVTALVIASALALAGPGAAPAPGTGQNPGVPPAQIYTYAAKWICNLVPETTPKHAEDIGLVPGEYQTDINVHLPTRGVAQFVTKKFVVADPEDVPTKSVSFTFYSGAAAASFGPNGEGPTTAGLGAIGANDPVTNVVTPPGPAIILFKNPAWGLIPGTQWVSYKNTTYNGPPNNPNPISFTVNFVLPAGYTSPSLTVTGLADDKVTVFLNSNQVGPSPLANFVIPGTASTSNAAFFATGSNTMRFDVTQAGGNGFGLDYTVTVSYTSAPPPSKAVYKQRWMNPDDTFFIDCNDILRSLKLPLNTTAKGYVILASTVPGNAQGGAALLDVVAEYSATSYSFTSAGTVEPVGISLDVERVPAVFCATTAQNLPCP